ncbi:hypothetical protein HDV00_001226, partial [Rhizophlyctis rosea]
MVSPTPTTKILLFPASTVVLPPGTHRRVLDALRGIRQRYTFIAVVRDERYKLATKESEWGIDTEGFVRELGILKGEVLGGEKKEEERRECTPSLLASPTDGRTADGKEKEEGEEERWNKDRMESILSGSRLRNSPEPQQATSPPQSPPIPIPSVKVKLLHKIRKRHSPPPPPPPPSPASQPPVTSTTKHLPSALKRTSSDDVLNGLRKKKRVSIDVGRNTMCRYERESSEEVVEDAHVEEEVVEDDDEEEGRAVFGV